MTDRSRWGFDALDVAEYDQFVAASSSDLQPSRRTPRPAVESEDDVVVDVALDDDGQISTVRLTPTWHRRIAPSQLGLELARVANVRAVERLSRPAPGTSVGPSDGAPVDLSPWGGSLERLTAAAQHDLALYERATAEAGPREVVVRGATGVVRVTGHAGLIDAIDIDSLWLRRASHAEIEAELTSSLTRARSQMSPTGIESGPSAPASRVLAELARRPAELLRAAGLAT